MALHIIDVAPKGGEVMARTSTVRASGTAPGQRKLNGPQTTGREYRSLSEPEYCIRLVLTSDDQSKGAGGLDA